MIAQGFPDPLQIGKHRIQIEIISRVIPTLAIMVKTTIKISLKISVRTVRTRSD